MVARSLLTKMAEICGDVFLWSCDRCPSDKKCCNLCEIRIQGSRGSFSSFKCSQHHFAANVQYPCRQTARQAPELQHGKEWEAMIRNVLRKTFVFFEQPLRRNVNSFQGIAKQPCGKWNNALECFSEDFDANSDKQTTTIPRSVQVPECSRTCLLCCGLPDSTSKFRRLCEHVVCVFWVNYEYYSFKYVLSMF